MATKKATPKKAAVKAPAKAPAKAPVKAAKAKKAPAKPMRVPSVEVAGSALTDAHIQAAGSLAETMTLIATLKGRLTNVLGIYATPNVLSAATGADDNTTFALSIDRDVRAVNSQLQAILAALKL